ncbi:MAG: c-type cytochrome [Acidobacteriota bacterium]
MPRYWQGVGRAAALCTATAWLGFAGLGAQPSAPASRSSGKEVYDRFCASCHGQYGLGDGPAAAMLAPTPRDLTKGVYKFRSTESGSLPTDDDLLRVVRDGVYGTSMIGWSDILSDGEIQAVVQHVKTLSPRFASERPAPVKVAPEPASTSESVAAGRAVYENLQCAACHGEEGRGAGAIAGVLQDDWGNLLKPARLTEPWSFRGGSSTRDIYLRLKTGINGTPMPAFTDVATDRELWDVANYVRSLGRTPTWEMTADELKAHYEQEVREATENATERGRQLAETMGCAHCHSPVDSEGRVMPGLKFAGGQKIRLGPWGDVVTANLTSDRETGLGSYTDEEILRAITRGIRKDGSRMLPFPMGWTAYAHLTDADQRALVAYLRTIPPVVNRIPPPAPLGFFGYLGAKYRMLIKGEDIAMYLFSGNAGSAGSEQAHAGSAQ